MKQQRGHELPRQITPSLLWTGGCFELPLREGYVHGHFCIYAIKGTEKVLLIDAGHPHFGDKIEASLDEFLEGRPVDFIMPTHAEFPHMGLIPRWMEKYPDSIVVGDVEEYDLYYPEYAHRMRRIDPGGSVSLGDRDIVVLPAVWYDLPDTIWAFDTKERVLFTSDGFPTIHLHREGQCGLLASEQELPGEELLRITIEIVFQWTRYLDVTKTFQALDSLIGELNPRFIASAHGPVIDDPKSLLPALKNGMIDRKRISQAAPDRDG